MVVSNWAVKNRTVVMAFCVAASVAGLLAYRALPLEAFPDVEIPYVMVMTRYRGVAPVDVERSITIKIEEELKGLNGIRHITSTSAEGSSQVVVEFEPDTPMEDALQKVKDRVDRAKGELPTDLDSDPDVVEISSSEFPIVTVVLGGSVGLPRLKAIAEDYQEEIEAIPGVIEAELSGGLEREIIVAVDLDRAVGYNLPITAVAKQITSENLSVSGGTIRMGSGRYRLRVPGEFEMPEEAEKLVVAVVDGEPVYLDDVATVKDGFKDETGRTRFNYESAVMLSVKKRTGANVVDIVDQIDRVLDRRASTLPGGVRALKINDTARFVKWLVKDLENNLVSGFVLVLVVVFSVMGLRNALLVSISIPLSMLIGFIALEAMGVTLNMIVLFSMTLSLGMLVDNAVVIVENIYRFMQAGVPRVQAACRATAEVAWPIIGSSTTTIAAFTPLLFWPGLMGKVFKFLPQTVITVLVSCLFVALVVNPALAAVFMKAKKRPVGEGGEDGGGSEGASRGDIDRTDPGDAGEKPNVSTEGIIGAYRRALGWSLKRRGLIFASAALVFMLSVEAWLLAVGIDKPQQFMPSVDPDTVYVQAKSPSGAGLDYNDAVMQEVEARIRGSADGLGGAGTTRDEHGGEGDREDGPSDLVDIRQVVTSASVEGGGFSFGPGES
ncbi:MAG: AcrB/AcrD/AcrF family protein, partial [Candidatus Eisenbacteria bacterium]|nr:AcrB/AcrD/AcrF family protein [Candidatus Eisenbacteria bacterium]